MGKKKNIAGSLACRGGLQEIGGGGGEKSVRHGKGHERRERTKKCRPVRLKGGGSLADELDACSQRAADPVGKD